MSNTGEIVRGGNYNGSGTVGRKSRIWKRKHEQADLGRRVEKEWIVENEV